MQTRVPTSRAFRRLLLMATLGAAVLLVPGSALAQTPGELTQKPIPDGCISQTGTGGACEDGQGLNDARRVAVSPDGANAYATSTGSDAIVVLDRNPATGALDQKPGTAGCISNTGSGGACVDGRALGNPNAIAISPDGSSVYVASQASDAIAIFDRDTATGEITQPAGTAGCIDNTAQEDCAGGRELNGAFGAALSADGTSLYVVAEADNALTIFDRAANGALAQKAGAAGCVNNDGSAVCQDGNALTDARNVVVSPDGDSVYVAANASDAIAVFDRAANGEVDQKAGLAGCVSDTGTGGTCVDGVALNGSWDVTVSPDGEQVYGSSQFSDAVTIFDRDMATGVISQKAGTEGCISNTGSGGACVDGRALNGARAVAVSPGGGEVYVASSASDGIAIFDRDATDGELSQKPALAGCVTNTGTGGTCQDGLALNNLRDVAVSPNGRSAYGAALTDDAVSVFDRAYPQATITDPDPGPVAFGVRSTSSGPSDPVQVTVTSTGTADVSFDSSTITGAGAGEFSVSTDGCAGTTVDPGATCTIDVVFDPATTGVKTATLEVGSNGQGSPQAIALTGTGITPGATITEPTVGPLDLGEQPIDAGPGPVRLVTVTSTGDAPVTFNSPSVIGAPDGQVLIGGNCAGVTLAPGESCRIGVSFDPNALGSTGATLEVRSDDPDSPDTLGLTGTGIPAGETPSSDANPNDYRALSGGQCSAGSGSAVLPGPQISGDQILFGETQLRTNQRIGQAAMLRLNAVQAWLDGGIEGRDIRGAVLGVDGFGAGVEWRVGSLAPIPPANPRPIEVQPLKPISEGDPITFTLQQLIINQRVYQEAIARANALEKRLDGMLTGGDVVDGSVGEGRLLPGLRIAALTLVSDPPAPSRTNVQKPKRGESELPQFSSTQLVTNQRIAATAVTRTNALIERIEAGLDSCSFTPGSLTGDDLTPPLPAPA